MKDKDRLPFESFKAFALKHPAFIVKANNLSCGRGLEVYQLAQDELSDEHLQNIYRQVQQSTPVVIEEWLVNDNSSGAYHDKSLNILRVIVFKTKQGALKISNCNYYTCCIFSIFYHIFSIFVCFCLIIYFRNYISFLVCYFNCCFFSENLLKILFACFSSSLVTNFASFSIIDILFIEFI